MRDPMQLVWVFEMERTPDLMKIQAVRHGVPGLDAPSSRHIEEGG